MANTQRKFYENQFVAARFAKYTLNKSTVRIIQKAKYFQIENDALLEVWTSTRPTLISS
jgi:hypothetical protein